MCGDSGGKLSLVSVAGDALIAIAFMGDGGEMCCCGDSDGCIGNESSRRRFESGVKKCFSF